MEIILAIVVASAVIFFGALISMGNERQRKAIDGLGEQIVFWATQDLKIKREQLTQNVRVDDPISWLNNISSRISKSRMNLIIIEILDNPNYILCTDSNSRSRIMFTALSPTEIQNYNKRKDNKLSSVTEQKFLPGFRNSQTYQLSVINCGYFFDIELRLAWQKLTGQPIDYADMLWMYIAP